MDIIGQSWAGMDAEPTTFIIGCTGNAEAKSLIDDLRREVESGRTRWFAVIGAGVETPNLLSAERHAEVTLDRSDV